MSNSIADMAKDEKERFDLAVRSRLRELRQERGLTLEELAARASIDTSTLSRLESGKRRLALDHLPGLADALEVSIDRLLPRQDTADPKVKPVARRYDGLTVWPLTNSREGNGLQAVKMRIDASRNRPPKELPVHEGRDWTYVLSGNMRLLLGDQDIVVRPGEAVEFSTWTPHWFGAIDGPVEILAILGPQGESIHVHGGELDGPDKG